MEFLLPGAFWAALTGSYVRLYREMPASASELDLSLIGLVYEFIAGESTCARCGDPLGRGLHFEVWSRTATSAWQVLVTTRCSSWRRHRHTAVVGEASGGLRFGSFMPVRRTV